VNRHTVLIAWALNQLYIFAEYKTKFGNWPFVAYAELR